MMSSPVKARIEHDLGMEFSWLMPQERYYFLQFLKNSDAAKIERCKRFFHEFSLAGIRTFTVLDYDTGLGDDILRLGEEKPELAHELFTHFDVLLDQTESFSGRLRSTLCTDDEAMSEDDTNALADQFHEALVRKTKDVLVGAMNSTAVGTEPGDALSALKGLNAGIFMLNDFFSEDPTYSSQIVPTQIGQLPQFLLTDLVGRQYRLKFNVRARAEKDAQARINVEICFDTEMPNTELQQTFQQETQWLDNPKRKNPEKESVLRLGIDLDQSNPLNPGVSLDIGRAAVDSPKRRSTGEKLGNILAAVSRESTHTPYSFDKRFSDPELFASLAGSFSRYLEHRLAA